MSYIINDIYHKLVIKLTTKLQNTSNVYIQAFKKNVSTPVTLVPVSIEDVEVPTEAENVTEPAKLLTFELRNKDYDVGTEFVQFLAVLGGEHDLTDLHQAVSVLVDGEEATVYKATEIDGHDSLIVDDKGNPKVMPSKNVTTGKFAIKFQDAKPHTLQAIFKGSKEIGIATSNKHYITAKQNGTGTYRLTSKVPKKLKYMAEPNWIFRLTLNGSPKSNEIIEIVTPTHTFSKTTNRQGQVFQNLPSSLDILARWTVGTYIIRAEFWKQIDGRDTLLCRTEDQVQIVKNDPKLTYIPSAGVGKYMAFILKDPQNRPLANKTLTITVNKKTTTKKTNAEGKIGILTNHKGNIKGKAKYAGDKNYNAKSVSFNYTVR